ncbi:hypothetical protein GcM3_005024 [Golovinomyces cichoracearum]|uniref:Uncharacterized protein n=1 Tax=Golovinomyces cichoracearum TaxID=62708 RepID=A0A420JAW6_9PEZI|nr:hypothetical protein GcM3_005024 [Golovinomyces cichoracearum]
MGTENIGWLDIWRRTKVVDGNNRYASLDILMSTLSQVAHVRECLTGHGQSAVSSYSAGRKKAKGKEAANDEDPEALCTHCKHQHNKNCLEKHPELKKRRKQKNSHSYREEGTYEGNRDSKRQEDLPPEALERPLIHYEA